MFDSKTRLSYGVKHEIEFENLFKRHLTIKCEPFGQVLLPDRAREILRNAKVHVDSALGKEWIEQLPEDWRHIYKRGIGMHLPSMSRWDPDYIIHEDKQPIAFAEIKSCITQTPNVSIEISGILAAILNKKRLGVLQIYVFNPWEGKDYWSYTTLDTLLEKAKWANDGIGTRGSNRPFVLVPKSDLMSNFENIFFNNETHF